MLFGFEFAVGFMLAFMLVPAAIWLVVLSAGIMRRAYRRAMGNLVVRALAIILVFAVGVAWVFTH